MGGKSPTIEVPAPVQAAVAPQERQTPDQATGARTRDRAAARAAAANQIITSGAGDTSQANIGKQKLGT